MNQPTNTSFLKLMLGFPKNSLTFNCQVEKHDYLNILLMLCGLERVSSRVSKPNTRKYLIAVIWHGSTLRLTQKQNYPVLSNHRKPVRLVDSNSYSVGVLNFTPTLNYNPGLYLGRPVTGGQLLAANLASQPGSSCCQQTEHIHTVTFLLCNFPVFEAKVMGFLKKLNCSTNSFIKHFIKCYCKACH